MKKMCRLIGFVLAVVLLLSGCNMRTFEQLYAPPKRSDAYRNLQNMIDQVMVGYEYSAPLTGQELQAVQMADLDGDGQVEYLLYARSNGEKPLSIFVFSRDADDFRLLDVIYSAGSAFDQVVYASLDKRPGKEIVVGRQLSDQVVRSVSVYSLVDGKISHSLTANYTKFLCTDLDSDGTGNLVVVKPNPADSTNGIAEYFAYSHANVPESSELSLSVPASRVRNVFAGILNDGYPAVYVESEYGSGLITDVLAIQGGKFGSPSWRTDALASLVTQRDYPVYATDIDRDGVPELPQLLPVSPPMSSEDQDPNQRLICWNGMMLNGVMNVKQYTYHNFTGGWYLALPEELARQVTVRQHGNGYEFRVWNEENASYDRILTLYVLTGQKREEQATTGNRFVLYRTENTVYAANLDVASAVYGMTQESVAGSFHLIFRDWKSSGIE